MDNYGSSGAYAAPPCAGCGPGAMPVPPPRLLRIDSYSYVKSIQKQLPQTANQMTSGMQQPTGSAVASIAPTPTLQDIASYSHMSPAQRQQQQQQLAQAGSQMFVGMPGWQTARNQTTQQVPSQQVTDASLAPITPTTQVAPISGQSSIFEWVPAYTNRKACKSGFLIGTNTLLDKTGILIGVGANFILLSRNR